MSIQGRKIGFIGAGNMGEALIKGLTATNLVPPKASTSAGSSSGAQPAFCASPATFTSIRQGWSCPATAARRAISSRSERLSTEWTSAQAPAT